MIRRAKIICTIGPASRDPETFRRLVDSGMDAVRVNFSHSSHEDAARTIALAREVARDVGRPLAVLADLQGPKIRVGVLPGPLDIAKGEVYVFEALHDADAGASGGAIPITYPDLASEMDAVEQPAHDHEFFGEIFRDDCPTGGAQGVHRAAVPALAARRRGPHLPPRRTLVPRLQASGRPGPDPGQLAGEALLLR